MEYGPYLDRSSILRRDAVALEALWGSPASRRIVVRDGAILAERRPGGAPRIAFLPPSQEAAEGRILLGVDAAGVSWWLVSPGGPAEPYEWLGLRELGPTLQPEHLEILMTAVALDSWHARHAFCPSCGGPTQVESAGWVRRCPAEGIEHYPRTDPAIIVLVIDPLDRALLARQSRWPGPWRSTLAGFVEPGEPAEFAVRREVSEEVGLALQRVEYVASQPWPFPGSLMLGFHAWAQQPTITVDGDEIAEADWFTRDELVAAAELGTIQLPPAISIARRLVERWYGEPLPGSWLRT